MPSSTDPRDAILVEGESDRRAVEVLARRRGRDLTAEGVAVVAMGGITNLGHHLDALSVGVRVTALYDKAEEAWVRRALARRTVPAALHACDEDLEDELIRALGIARVVGVIEAQGDLMAWETLQNQPFHRDRPQALVLRRFFGTTSGRKIAYAGHLTGALDLDRVPAPLDRALEATLP